MHFKFQYPVLIFPLPDIGWLAHWAVNQSCICNNKWIVVGLPISLMQFCTYALLYFKYTQLLHKYFNNKEYAYVYAYDIKVSTHVAMELKVYSRLHQ